MSMRRYGEAERQLESLEWTIESGIVGNEFAADGDSLPRRAQMMRCVLHGFTGRADTATQLCVKWLSWWGRRDPGDAAIVQATLGYTAYMRGDYKRARHCLTAARKGIDMRDPNYGLAWVETLMALTAFEEGNIAEADEILVAAVKANEKVTVAHSFGAAMLALAQAQVYYEQNRLDEAQQLLDRALVPAKTLGPPEMFALAFRVQAKLRWLRSGPDEADRCLAEGVSIADKAGLLRPAQALECERILLGLRNGKAGPVLREHSALAANRLLDASTSRSAAGDAMPEFEIHMLALRIEIARGQLDDAHRSTAKLLDQARRQGHGLQAVRLLCLRAIVQRARGNRDEALRTLSDALSAGVPRGVCRVFTDEGAALAALLHEFSLQRIPVKGNGDEGRASVSLETLIKALEAEPVPRYPRQAAPAGVDPCALSERELQILQLLARGLGNRDLAAQLFLSEATIKWHLRHIYSKLDVKNRSSAIMRAHELSLLSGLRPKRG
jgi:LuxR family maltose regulon positive regulatory protein